MTKPKRLGGAWSIDTASIDTATVDTAPIDTAPIGDISRCGAEAGSLGYGDSMNSPYKWNSPVTVRRTTRRGAVGVLGVAGALVLASCGGATDQFDVGAAPVQAGDVAAAVPVSAPVVSGAQGIDLLEQGAVLIDVRTPGEYDEVRIEGATLIDVSSPDFDALVSELDPNETYVVYCRSGSRSVPATQRMMQLGLGSVYDMGGIIDWVAEGHPTVSG